MRASACVTPGCPDPRTIAKGLCSLHYYRQLRGVDANAPPKKPWTAADLEELRSAYVGSAEDINVTALAGRMGRSVDSIHLKAGRLGLGDPHRKRVRQPKVRLPMFTTAEERNRNTGRQMKARIAANGHPRGMAGKRHTPATLAVLSRASRALWAAPGSPLRTEEMAQKRSDLLFHRRMRNPFSRGAGGRRTDLSDVYFRSSWEANYARYLDFLLSRGQIASWDYECKTFIFERITRGTRSYLPDFKVRYVDGHHEWHEVKGWMDAKSRVKLERMAYYFPKETVVVRGSAWFRQASKSIAPMIPLWEKG